jgi:hypothetical protein
MGKTPVKSKSKPATPKQIVKWLDKINATWASHKQVSTVIETGKLLKQVKKALGYGNWGAFFKGPGKPSFSIRTAGMLMEIAEHPVLSNPKYISDLPPCWSTMYLLRPLRRLEDLIADGTVHPDLQQSDVHEIISQEDRRDQRASRKNARAKRNPRGRSADAPPRSSKRKPDAHKTLGSLRGLRVDTEYCQAAIRQDWGLWDGYSEFAHGILDIIGDEPPTKSASVKSKSTEPRTGAVH